ncbi:MAG: hypothetical protein ACJ74F_18350 [Mycobacterium sp.]|uniref:hypothetical protein n=1 Tax=Mycobacterium sp. TaxID=1785 RepID=UPI00389A16CA
MLLSVLAVTAGALAATVDRTADARVLFGLLALGQLVAHVMLTVVGHTDCAASGGPPPVAMLAAHAVALVAGAALIAAGDRLCKAVTSALHAFAGELPGMLATAATAAVTAGDQPLRSALKLTAPCAVARRSSPSRCPANPTRVR